VLKAHFIKYKNEHFNLNYKNKKNEKLINIYVWCNCTFDDKLQ
jgi:hypothetical protein